MKHFVSIVLPVHNEGKWLKDCIDSLLNQTYSDFEIILIDDGSKDNSWEIIQEYSKIYPQKVKAFRFEKNRGEASARNKGIELSSGDLIIQTDADTIFPKDFLEKSIKYFIEDENICAISIGELRVHPALKGLLADYWRAKRKASFLIRKSGRKGIGGFYMFKKEIISKIGVYDETLPSACDFDFAQRVFKNKLNYKWAEDVYFYHADTTNLIKFLKRLFNAGRYNMPALSRWNKWPTGIKTLPIFIRNILTFFVIMCLFLTIINKIFLKIALIIFIAISVLPLIIFKEPRTMWLLSLKEKKIFLFILIPFIFFLQTSATGVGKLFAILFPDKVKKAVTFDV